MQENFAELLRELNAHNAKYLVIGGFAVSYYAEARATKDIDILIGRDPENAKSVFAALAAFGSPLEDLTPADLIDENSFFRMGSPPWMVDVLPEVVGIDFDHAWTRRQIVRASPLTDLLVNVVSRADLIQSKMAAGRMQDLADVEALSVESLKDAASLLISPDKKKDYFFKP